MEAGGVRWKGGRESRREGGREDGKNEERTGENERAGVEKSAVL